MNLIYLRASCIFLDKAYGANWWVIVLALTTHLWILQRSLGFLKAFHSEWILIWGACCLLVSFAWRKSRDEETVALGCRSLWQLGLLFLAVSVSEVWLLREGVPDLISLLLGHYFGRGSQLWPLGLDDGLLHGDTLRHLD